MDSQIKIQKSKDVLNARKYLSYIFIDGFYMYLKYFSKDKIKLEKAFEHVFNLELFYLATHNGEVAGMAAVTDGKTLPINLDKKTLIKNLGIIKGRIAYHVLKKEFEVLNKHNLPTFPEVSFVSVLQDKRRLGVAETLINHIIGETEYESYILEVASNNIGAIKLYEKIGFKTYYIHPVKKPKQTGFDKYLYLLYEKPKPTK